MMIAASQKAWAHAEKANAPRFFFDLRGHRDSFEKGQTPQTPAISLLYGLQAALQMVLEEGIEQGQERHRLMGEMARAGAQATGLELLCQDEGFASNTVTAVKIPQGVEASTFRKAALKSFGVVLAGGQGKIMKDMIFRIGHMGYVTPNDVLVALAAVENSLALLGYPVQVGNAVAAAQRVWLLQASAKK
jgi:aspartate aminotransferase-like enzyme